MRQLSAVKKPVMEVNPAKQMKKLEILKEFKRKYAEEDLGQAKDGGKDGK